MRRGAAAGAVCLTLALSACLSLAGRPDGSPSLARSAARLAAGIAAAADGRVVTFLGLRGEDAAVHTGAQALGELLDSELTRAGVDLAPVAWEERDDLEWDAGARLPRDWSQVTSGLILGGQVLPDDRLSHLRLVLADAATGAVLWSGSEAVWAPDQERLARELKRRTRSRARPGDAAAADIELSMDLHVVARRDEESFAQAVEVVEGGELREGDRLQIRFRTGADCQVYAFLFGSDGERRVLYDPELVYTGRLQFGPSEEGFLTLSEADRVYTLYVLAAEQLDGLGELFGDLDDLVQRSQVDRFTGLDKADEVVAAYLERHTDGEAEIAVGRGPEAAGEGKSERWVYADGQALETRAQTLSGRRALARAISFEVTHP